jgi:hypothetical protein
VHKRKVEDVRRWLREAMEDERFHKYRVSLTVFDIEPKLIVSGENSGVVRSFRFWENRDYQGFEQGNGLRDRGIQGWRGWPRKCWYVSHPYSLLSMLADFDSQILSLRNFPRFSLGQVLFPPFRSSPKTNRYPNQLHLSVQASHPKSNFFWLKISPISSLTNRRSIPSVRLFLLLRPLLESDQKRHWLSSSLKRSAKTAKTVGLSGRAT